MKKGKVATRQTRAQIMQPDVWEMSTGVRRPVKRNHEI